MNKWTKRIIGVACASVLTFAVVTLSCAKTKVEGSAETRGTVGMAYAETPVKSNFTEAEALTIVEALQTSFRSVTDRLLPAVVEVDVTETKTRSNPMGGFGFNFGWPFDDFFGNGNGEPQEYQTSGLGSGVIVKRDGKKHYVLTNNHVAGSATTIKVVLNDGRKFDGTLVGTDKRLDIALVSFEAEDDSIPVAKLGDSDEVHAGDICLAFGAPLGYSQSVTQGIVSATGRNETQMSSVSDFIQTDAAINQGNSGGPLVNIYGEVIGINTWIASSSGGSVGLGFAIPINNIKSAIDSFIKDGQIVYGWLGVSLVEVDEDYKKDLKVNNIEGALAAEVFIDSPADKAGIKPGDYIIELNGKKIKTVNQLVRDVGYLEAGTISKFKVIRGGKELPEISVKIEKRESDSDSQNNKLWPGFIASSITKEARKQLKIDDKVNGVLITSVSEKSPAAALRLENGGIITAVNGVAVKNVAEFYEELSKATTGINFDVYTEAGTVTTGTFKLK
ncbi:MAG: Do family serine endopeptidase [Treponema sp.]|nr:Do family serine endopeptidase [Treponema sp.]